MKTVIQQCRQNLIWLIPVVLCFTVTSSAEQEKLPARKKAEALSMYANGFSAITFFEDSNNTPEKAARDGEKANLEQGKVSPQPVAEAVKPVEKKDAPVFVSSNPRDGLVPPDQDPKVRINPEAPSSFVGMAEANQNGDQETAKAYARQFVRYLTNMMFQVRQITQLIGEAMVEEGTVDEEDWVGVEQYLDWELAKGREQTGSPLRATHEESLKRITADVNGEVEIYYFFTLNCGYCRKMAPDVERLWQVTKSDPKVRMVALTLGPVSKEWIDAYRDYTGMTMPILDGEKVAKTFRVGFVPALVAVAPSSKTAFSRTGQLSFERMFEFVRTVQGQPKDITPPAQRLLAMPIGQLERQAGGRAAVVDGTARASLKRTSLAAKEAANAGDGLNKF